MSEDEAFKKLKRLETKKLILEYFKRRLTKEISKLEDKIADRYRTQSKRKLDKGSNPAPFTLFLFEKHAQVINLFQEIDSFERF